MLPEQPGPNIFGVNYAPGIYTTVNSQVVYTVTVEDDADLHSRSTSDTVSPTVPTYIHPATAENGNYGKSSPERCMTLNRLFPDARPGRLVP